MIVGALLPVDEKFPAERIFGKKIRMCEGFLRQATRNWIPKLATALLSGHSNLFPYARPSLNMFSTCKIWSLCHVKNSAD